MTEQEQIFYKTIGKNIRFFRERCFMNKYDGRKKDVVSQRLNQRELGKQINVTFQQIQKYENGKNAISVYNLLRFCKFFQVPLKFFTDEETPSKIPYTRNLHNVQQQDNL